ncbi:MAG TPA: hypothetical protein VHD90_28565 [Phototrophicaceae bacterium]|nr:hypothetical protein [Phototrophicaceae bacterium]
MIPEISLNTHWRQTSAPDADDGSDVPLLAQFEPRRIKGKMAWLEREFDLPMQDVCINYLLRIDAVAQGTHLSINGRDFGEIAAPLEIDVTDNVALEDNKIVLRVLHNAFGAFGTVQLIAVPCE